MILTKLQAQRLAYGEPVTRLEVEADEQVSTRRWVSVHQLVVRDEEGRFWAATYERGLTENQDTEPFEDDDDVEFHEVRKVPVTSYRYEKK